MKFVLLSEIYAVCQCERGKHDSPCNLGPPHFEKEGKVTCDCKWSAYVDRNTNNHATTKRQPQPLCCRLGCLQHKTGVMPGLEALVMSSS